MFSTKRYSSKVQSFTGLVCMSSI